MRLLPQMLALIFLFSAAQAQQRWRGQIGSNLATLPGQSVEITSAWSPSLDRWALTFNAGYTFNNAFGRLPANIDCDCGIDHLKTSGAFFKAGYRFDAVRLSGKTAKVGIPIGVNLIGSQYRQRAVTESFGTGTAVYTPRTVSGFVVGLSLTVAMNIRFSSRWNLDLGVQKFIGLQKRTDYFLFPSYQSHQPGVGLTDWKSFWPGLQGLVGLNYRLGRL